MTTYPSRTTLWAKSRWAALTAVTVGLVLSGVAHGADVGVHSSNRYYQDASGRPMFLIGYYAWASAADGYYIDHPARYRLMMEQGSPYLINYIRIGLQGNRMSGTTDPQSWNHQPTPVAVAYVNVGGTYKADLSQFDSVFWDGVKAQCARAKELGFIVDLSLFDGVSLRGGASWGYGNSWWNPANHAGSYYPAGDYGDGVGAFYRLSDFNNNTGIGYYQRRHIDKAITETKDFDNVIFEVGNELAADSAWNSAVIAYFKAKCAAVGTNKLITQGGNSATAGQIGVGTQGWGQHWATVPAQTKASLAIIVGQGYPAWEDPDNNEWANYLGFPALAYDTGCRQAAWYSFAGGAPIYGNFTVDFWDWWGVQRGFSTPMATFIKNLQDFIAATGVHFWEMTPQHSLVSNSGVNSCLAKPGTEYVAYILSDATATLNLSSVPGTVYYCLYDPTTGVFGNPQTVAGGAVRSFTKPAGASDWAIYASSSPLTWQNLNVKTASTILLDGSSSDWNLSEFTTPIMGGQSGNGDYIQVDRTHYGSYTGALPTSAADHTAKVYVRHDAGNIYFLVRSDDNDIQYGNPVGSNYLNDCVEIFIDPRNDHGAAAMSNSASDIRVVIDANNQKNVYGCTDTYKTQVLAGVVSAVVRDGTGWTLEAKIAKSAISPILPNTGRFGLEFSLRDNDSNNDPAQTTVYTWHDRSGTGLPSQIPDNWGDASVTPAPQTPYAGVIPIPGIIQAENYDNGGEGLAYHDTDAVNSGGVYRTDGVDVEPCSDTGGGYNVGYINTAEWLAYTVNVAVGGYYDINARVASPGGGGSLRIQLDGQDVASLAVPSTGAWQTWATVTASTIPLSVGQQVLKVFVDTGGWNLNYLDIETSTSGETAWNTLGPTVSLGNGTMPAAATDSQGYLHVAYLSGSNIAYKKYNPNLLTAPLVSETIGTPQGAYWIDIKCDASDVPHIVFSEGVGNPAFPYTNYTFYTNRIGGSWKTAFQVNYDLGKYPNPVSGPDDKMTCLPTIGLCGNYAYVGTWLTVNAGKIVRLSNLSAAAPTLDATAYTSGRSTIAVNSACHVFSVGRNAGASYAEEFESNLSPVTGTRSVFFGYAGAPHVAWAAGSLVHFLSWEAVLGGTYPCKDLSRMCYNNTGRRDTNYNFQSPILGLNGGPAGTGPDGTEPSGFWNDDVSPAMAVDAKSTVYVAWRFWSPAGPGTITKVDNSSFTQTCSLDPTCGGNICTGTPFAPSLPRRRWWNCELTPHISSGVYVIWESGGTMYIRGVGTPLDLTPPGPVTNFVTTTASDRITLSWTNPTDSDFTGTMIRYKTTGNPTGPGDGTLLVDQTGTPGSADQVVHIGPRCGSIYYYAVFSHDLSSNYSSAVSTTGKIQCGDFDLDGDVDQSDFGFLQRCLSDTPADPACEPADLNPDGYVDGADYNVFAPCMAGANKPPGC